MKFALSLAVFAAISSWNANAATAEPDAVELTRQSSLTTGWKEVSCKREIRCFKKDVDGSPIVAFRGEGVIDAPIATVASVVLDHERGPEWIDSLVEARLIRMTGPLTFIEWNHVGMPPLITDRDFLNAGRVVADGKLGLIDILIVPVEDAAMPVGKKVRGELRGHWNLKSIENGTKTYAITDMQADPKGSLPKWLVNLFQNGWAQDTLDSLRKQVKKTDLKVIPQVEEIFGKMGK